MIGLQTSLLVPIEVFLYTIVRMVVLWRGIGRRKPTLLVKARQQTSQAKGLVGGMGIP